jgi:hypothetical protein
MLRMDSDLRIRLPASLRTALERAACRNFTSVSTYTRQALLQRLIEDGILSAGPDDLGLAEG